MAEEKKDWVDFKQVKQAVSMEMVLDHYGINWLRKNKDELRGRCPIHKGEGDRSFHANLTKNIFNCFSCKARGNVLDFVAAMQNCSIRDAALLLKLWFSVYSDEEKQAGHPGWNVACEVENTSALACKKLDQTEKPPAIINPPLSFQLRVDPTDGYGLNRGLAQQTIEKFGAGLCLSKGTFSGRYVIPLHNELGELVGYAGRSIDDTEPKYLFPSREKGFYKSHLLFNLHRVLTAMERTEALQDYPVVIVEGFFGCMKVVEAGPLCVGLLGSSLSDRQEQLICQQFKAAILLLDGDDAGRACRDDCASQLVARGLWVTAINLEAGQQPDNLAGEAIAGLVASARLRYRLM